MLGITRSEISSARNFSFSESLIVYRLASFGGRYEKCGDFRFIAVTRPLAKILLEEVFLDLSETSFSLRR